MIALTRIRDIATALPEVQGGPPVPAAHRSAAFKVAGKSFLGLESGRMTMTVSLPEKEAKLVTADQPDAYQEIWRNRTKFMGLRVDLSKVSSRRVRELIETSWRHSALKHIVAAND